MAISGEGPFLFPSDRNRSGHQTALKTVWQNTLRRAKIPHFRIYDLRSTYATRLSARGVADEWVTQMLRQSDAQVFKKYSQMKLQMKREALVKLIGTLAHTRPFAIKLDTGCLTAATFAAPFSTTERQKP
jgi:integrase